MTMGLMKNIGITATLTAYLLGSVGFSYAAQHKSTQKIYTPIKLEESIKADYKTVDDILGDSFEAISSHNYDEKVKDGKCVVMFYDSSYKDEGPETGLAKVFSSIAPDYDNQIKFFYLDSRIDETLLKYGKKAFMKEYDIEGVPAYAFYLNGKRIYSHTGGPGTPEKVEKDIPIMKSNLKELADM